MLTTLAGGQPADQVPLWELEFHLWNRYSRYPIVLGKEFAKLTPGEQEIALDRNAELMAGVSLQLGFNAVTAPAWYWETSPGQPAYFWLPDEARMRFLPKLRAAAGDALCVIGHAGGMIMPPANRYVEFAYEMYDEPERVDTWAQETLRTGLEQVKQAQDAGIEVVVAPCDIADNHGVYFTPAQLERFWLPYLVEWSRRVKAMGMYSILHSDGNLTSVLDSLARTDLHAIQAIDPVAGMDLVAVKEQVGSRLCLCGNIDCGLLQFGPAEKIYEATRDVCLAGKPGGGFVLGGSNAIFTEIPQEHYEAMLAAWRDYGRYD